VIRLFLTKKKKLSVQNVQVEVGSQKVVVLRTDPNGGHHVPATKNNKNIWIN
jgi:hypothetical protein